MLLNVYGYCQICIKRRINTPICIGFSHLQILCSRENSRTAHLLYRTLAHRGKFMKWREKKPKWKSSTLNCNGECECLFSFIQYTRLSGRFYSFEHVTIAPIVQNSRAHLQFDIQFEPSMCCGLWWVSNTSTNCGMMGKRILSRGENTYITAHRRRTNGHLLNSSIASILCRYC